MSAVVNAYRFSDTSVTVDLYLDKITARFADSMCSDHRPQMSFSDVSLTRQILNSLTL